jgi:hypothetical protein
MTTTARTLERPTLLMWIEWFEKGQIHFDSFDQWVKQAPTEYLMCRDTGHLWAGDGWEGDNVEKLEMGAVMLHAACERCTLPRARYIGPYGEIDGSLNWYDYKKVPGYLYQPKSGTGYSLGKSDRMKIRVELRRRSQADAAAARRSRKLRKAEDR